MDFALFILLNAVLLIRPEELFPEVTGLRLYLFSIIICTLSALPKLLDSLSIQQLRLRPISICVLGMMVAAALSLVVRGRMFEAFDFMGEFGKVILYFFLLVSIIDTPDRFRQFIGWLIVFILASTCLTLAHHLELVYFEALIPVYQREYDATTGIEYMMPRLVSSGMFNDPNDFCLILVFGMMCCLYMWVSCADPLLRFICILPIVPFAFAFTLTHSRGGLLGLLGGIVAWLYARYGSTRALPLVLIGIPLVMVAVGGRQGSIEGGGTAHERLMLWAYGLGDLFRMPLYLPTGLGVGYYLDEYYFVAHNSFINAYVELGLLGGGFFLGAFYMGARMSDAVGKTEQAPDWAMTARPFMFAVVVGYAVGCYSISRNFVIPTYLALGLAAAYFQLASPTVPDQYVVNQSWWKRLAILSVLGLIFLKYFTQIAGQLGV